MCSTIVGPGSWCARHQRQTGSPGSVSEQPHIVILGGGFGGLSAALQLVDVPARVTVVDKQNHHLFQPLLYQVATAALFPGDIASPIRWVLRHHTHTQVFLGEAR